MLKRSNEDAVLGGVCGGLGEWTDTNPWAWRLIFLFAPGSGWAYLILWIALKEKQKKIEIDNEQEFGNPV
jgi:phage shock protein PspC (stress-responsive transcriptional regulator)